MFLCFERVAFSSGRGFFFRCASFLKDTLCSYKSFFLCDQVLCSALASLPPCLLEIFTHKSGWHQISLVVVVAAVVGGSIAITACKNSPTHRNIPARSDARSVGFFCS